MAENTNDPTQQTDLVNARSLTITVKCDKLYTSNYPPNQTIINDCTSFVEGGKNGNIYDYTKDKEKVNTTVVKNGAMWWEINADLNDKNPLDYEISLLSIVEKSQTKSTNIFNTNPLFPRKNDGKIKAIVKNGDIGNYYEYFILFEIKKGADAEIYAIDPKLQIQNTL